MMRRFIPLLTLLALVSPGCSRASSSPASNAIADPPAPSQIRKSKKLLLVINTLSPDSLRIGQYYADKRGIPDSDVVRIQCQPDDGISAIGYEENIAKPIGAALKKGNYDYVVTTRGMPLRAGSGGYSVNALLATLEADTKPLQNQSPAELKRCANPYFNQNEPFSHRKYRIYLTTRLDAFSLESVYRLIDRGIAAKPEKGLFYWVEATNRRTGGYGVTQAQLDAGHRRLVSKGFDSEIQTTGPFMVPQREIMGYAGWGSNDGFFKLDMYRALRFKPGAIAQTFVSTSARTFKHESGGQSLIADLIEGGVCGVSGYVSEPYTFGLGHQDILMDQYTSGYTLGESFWMACPVLNWKEVVIGDPLCRPYG